MNYLTIKQEELRGARTSLGDSGGGTALAQCIEAIELISECGDTLDEKYRKLVIEAVAEVFCMPVTVGRYPAN